MPPLKALFDSSTPLKNFQLVFFLLFAVGFMVQGWGDRAGLLSHPARSGLLVILALSTLFLLFVPFDLFATGTKEVPRQRWLTFLALGAVGGLCWYLPHADRWEFFVWPESDLLRDVGLAATAIGMAIRIAGMMQLGQLFSGFVTLQPEHRLITTGCYRWVRHPIYSGSLLAFVGFFLIFRSKIVLIAAPAYLIGTLLRITDEERLFTETFGAEYEQYRARTWRLLPFVY
jgi:protein-S-isoprenylcysteine O-methyltransferase Ste14